MSNQAELAQQLAAMRSHETVQIADIAVLRRPTYWAMALGDPVEIVRASTADEAANRLLEERERWSLATS